MLHGLWIPLPVDCTASDLIPHRQRIHQTITGIQFWMTGTHARRGQYQVPHSITTLSSFTNIIQQRRPLSPANGYDLDHLPMTAQIISRCRTTRLGSRRATGTSYEGRNQPRISAATTLAHIDFTGANSRSHIGDDFEFSYKLSPSAVATRTTPSPRSMEPVPEPYDHRLAGHRRHWPCWASGAAGVCWPAGGEDGVR